MSTQKSHLRPGTQPGYNTTSPISNTMSLSTTRINPTPSDVRDVAVPVDDTDVSLARKGSLRTDSIRHETNSQCVTYTGQSNLPPLPIPTLEETLGKFLECLEALQEYDEQRETAKLVVKEFLEGDGPKLQRLLVEYDRAGRENGLIGSYVEEFWNDSYLAPDSSVVLVRTLTGKSLLAKTASASFRGSLPICVSSDIRLCQ